jgi:hypothetical protein
MTNEGNSASSGLFSARHCLSAAVCSIECNPLAGSRVFIYWNRLCAAITAIQSLPP